MEVSGATSTPFYTSLVSGAAAGVAVDVSLFPLDTLKTRAQSAQGFMKAGGFKGIYRGLSAAALGSAPGAALFFVAYDKCKSASQHPAMHMLAASIGEICACFVRVPTENVKQKVQAGIHSNSRTAIQSMASSGGVGNFFVGYWTTVMREIPFSMIQFPIYEALKTNFNVKDPLAAALCGSIAGSVAAAITTPIDVAKTRQMLDVKRSAEEVAAGRPEYRYRGIGMLKVIQKVYQQEGFAALWSGVVPRVTWISIGGFVFFGAYETTKKIIS